MLERIGMAQALPSCIEACTARGAYHQRARPPVASRAHWSRTSSPAPRGAFRFAARIRVTTWSPGAARCISAPRVPRCTWSTCKTREYRESLLQDLYDAARIVDALDHIHFFQRTLVPRDMVGAMELDLNTLYACIAGHHQACRHQLLPRRHAERRARDPASRRRRRGRMAGAAVRQPVLLLRRAALALRRGCLPRAWRSPSPAACRCCCCRPGRPAPPRRRRWRARSSRRWPRCWRACATSTRSSPARRRSSAPGRSSPTCAPVRCRAAAPSRRC